MPYPWKHLGPGGAGLWATWSGWRCPCSWQRYWTRWSSKVPSHPNHSMILWFYEDLAVITLLSWCCCFRGWGLPAVCLSSSSPSALWAGHAGEMWGKWELFWKGQSSLRHPGQSVRWDYFLSWNCAEVPRFTYGCPGSSWHLLEDHATWPEGLGKHLRALASKTQVSYFTLPGVQW